MWRGIALHEEGSTIIVFLHVYATSKPTFFHSLSSQTQAEYVVLQSGCQSDYLQRGPNKASASAEYRDNSKEALGRKLLETQISVPLINWSKLKSNILYNLRYPRIAITIWPMLVWLVCPHCGLLVRTSRSGDKFKVVYEAEIIAG